MPENESPNQEIPHKTEPPKATLAQFIETNSKLVTSIAAFVALCAFSSQLDNGDAKTYIGGLSLLAAMLLTIELFRQLPPEPHHWLLAPFHLILLILVYTIGVYWFSKFIPIWKPIALVLVVGLVLLGIPALFTHYGTKLIAFIAARFFHHQLSAHSKTRIEQYGFMGIMGIGFLCWLLISYIFAGRTIRIPIPF